MDVNKIPVENLEMVWRCFLGDVIPDIDEMFAVWLHGVGGILVYFTKDM